MKYEEKKTVLQDTFGLRIHFALKISFDFFDLITWESLIL